jgi:hypothetical protein
MGRVGALPPARLDQLVRLQPLQHGLEEPALGPAGDEPGAELAQHRRIEALVFEGQAERVFPVDAAADGIGRLAVGQPLDELEDRHQRQLGRVCRRLPVLRVEIGEIGAAEQGAERVVHPEIRVPAREGCPRHPRGLVRQAVEQRCAQ